MFFFVNNFYAMGGQPLGETLALDRIARLGAGFRADGFHAATIDGNDPLAVFAEVRDRRALLLDGKGPALLDCETYRFSGHSSSDSGVYRTREEVSLWESFDPIGRFAARLQAAGVIEDSALAEVTASTIEILERIAAVATDVDRSPRLPLLGSPEVMDKIMYASSEVDLAGTHPVDLLQPLEENDRVKQLARRSRSGIVDGEQLSAFRAVQYRDALFEAILEHASRDDRLVIYGEENREYGGAFGVYRGLTELLPLRHLFNSPISEAAIVGTAVGVALEGGRALIELMYADFIGRAGDEIFNQMAKWRAMSGGIVEIPIVLRISVGSRYGAQHAQDWSGLVAQVPGIQVVYPATPYDAKGLLAAALAGNNPVAFFESQDLYDQTEIFHAEGVPANYYRIPIGSAATVRTGTHATVVTIGAALYRAMGAAKVLAEDGIEIEVIDARSLVPFDYDMIGRSVAKTRRVVLVTDSPRQGCFAGSVAAECALRFQELEVAPSVVASKNWIVPPPELVDAFRPSASDITEAVRQALQR
jgi:2-oxoisovalerate dehydrogenase E1 component